MNGTGAPASPAEGALQYIREVLPFAKRPVFLVVSIVNPHDVLFYPQQVCAVVCCCCRAAGAQHTSCCQGCSASAATRGS